jgi:hypothetical protein
LCFMHNATVTSVTWVFRVVYLTHLAINEDVTLRMCHFLIVLMGMYNPDLVVFTIKLI